MKFAHLADTHIRNLKYHFEYKQVFERMYEILRNEKVDYIIHCGDIAHTKTQISPEFVEMCGDFLLNLSKIAPTYIILGNHDGNLKNSNRQDALTPIIKALNCPDLFLLKNSGETALDSNFTLNVLSVFDEENWQEPSDQDRINIALYHGSISGCDTDTGWTMEHGENDISIFKSYDYAMLGDIHKTNQILDDHGKVRYCGSTIQQNHGETNDKGFLIWDIKDKNSFNCKHVSVLNPKPFVTVELDSKGKIPKKTEVPPGARLRVVANNNVPLDALRKAMDAARFKFKPETVTFLNRAAGKNNSVEELASNFAKEDLRDLAIQKKLIKEYLKDHDLDDEVLSKVYELNKKYNTIAEQGEEISRNINWRLSSLRWDNLFNYGEGNRIDFNNLNGIVGIFGKNYSGKSSIVDSLLYTLYDKTSKNNRKNLHVINQNKEGCVGNLEILVGNKRYNINRNAEKYEKTLHGKTTIEAKTSVDFSVFNKVTEETVSLNGTSRPETDKNIRKIFGTVEDFLFTSMASQVDSLAFIKEGSTKRKEILAKFLDLEIFDKKFKLAKDDASEIRGNLKRLEEREFEVEIENVKDELETNQEMTDGRKAFCQKIKSELTDLEKEAITLENMISAIAIDPIDIEGVKVQRKNKKQELNSLLTENSEVQEQIIDKKELLIKIQSFVEDFDINELRENLEIASEKQKKIIELENEISLENNKLKNNEKKVKLLEEVPCGSEYSNCKFIKDAYTAQEKVDIFAKAVERAEKTRNSVAKDIEKLNPEKLQEHFEKYDKIKRRENNLSAEISGLNLILEKNRSKKEVLDRDLQIVEDKIQEYEQNKEMIDNLENLSHKKRDIVTMVDLKTQSLEECETELLKLYKIHGSFEQQLENLENQRQELINLREDYSSYDLFTKCMHPNGIPYDIIKRKLPLINEEIAKVLANVVDFEVFFEAESKKLEIFIKHPKYEARPIELGSGAEKTIAAMAIRLALLDISSLPKPDLFVLDEPGTDLDEDNLEGFIRILDMIKSAFKTVLLISHLDSLKDCADTTIEIERQEGLAFVNQ